jgi:hypothetical protein
MPDFKPTSKVEIIPGHPWQCGGPHPPSVHADEVELMDEETWEEAKKIPIKETQDAS